MLTINIYLSMLLFGNLMRTHTSPPSWNPGWSLEPVSGRSPSGARESSCTTDQEFSQHQTVAATIGVQAQSEPAYMLLAARMDAGPQVTSNPAQVHVMMCRADDGVSSPRSGGDAFNHD